MCDGRGGLSLISIIDLTVVTNETPMRGHKINRGKQNIDKKKANFKNQLKSKLTVGSGKRQVRVVLGADKHLMDSEIKKKNRKRQEQREVETKQVKQRTKRCDAKGETLKMDKSRMRRDRSDRGGQVEPFE